MHIRTFCFGALLLTTPIYEPRPGPPWYDSYERGVQAALRSEWPIVIGEMTAAINQLPQENDKQRAYGALFINYHPYYYRGYANLRSENYAEAVADLDRARGAWHRLPRAARRSPKAGA